MLDQKGNILFCSNNMFESIKDRIVKLGLEYITDDIAFTIITDIDGIIKSVIVVNTDIFQKMNRNEKTIMLYHEMAHSVGIKDEEEADLFALDYLNLKQRNILISHWKMRHGHIFKELGHYNSMVE